MTLPRQEDGPGTPEKTVALMGRDGPSVLLPVGSPLMVTWPGVSSVMSTPAGRSSTERERGREERRRRRRVGKWLDGRIVGVVWGRLLPTW